MSKALCDVPTSDIRIVNPRTRSKQRFDAVLSSIAKVGLKKPITVVRRLGNEEGPRYDLVCGQGRLEAFLKLGQKTIPANVIDASGEDQFVMSLVENIARRPPSNKELFREVLNLKTRGYDTREIAVKIGRDASEVSAIAHLIDLDEADLVAAVEGNRIPLSIALTISRAEGPEIQRALSDAYESGELRGKRFKHAKSLIANRSSKGIETKDSNQEPGLTGRALVREYQRRIREQEDFVKRASRIREKLLLLKTAMKTLFGDEHFLTLLRAEELQEIPHQLACDGALIE